MVVGLGGGLALLHVATWPHLTTPCPALGVTSTLATSLLSAALAGVPPPRLADGEGRLDRVAPRGASRPRPRAPRASTTGLGTEALLPVPHVCA